MPIGLSARCAGVLVLIARAYYLAAAVCAKSGPRWRVTDAEGRTWCWPLLSGT